MIIKKAYFRLLEKILLVKGRKKREILFSTEQLKNQPFFILSAGRSGSTLIRTVLNSNAEVVIPPETDDLIPKSIKTYISGYEYYDWNEMVDQILELANSEPSFQYWDIDPFQNKECLYELPKEKRTLYSILFHLFSIYGEKNDKKIKTFGDKTPYLTVRLELIRLLYPKGRFIFLVRDGRAVVHSMVNNFGYTLPHAIKRWKTSLKVLDKLLKFHPEKVFYLKYEDFLKEPEMKTKQLFEFIGVENPDVEKALMDRYTNGGDLVLPHHKSVRKKLDTENIDKWKREISKSEKEFLTNRLKKDLIRWGYDPFD